MNKHDKKSTDRANAAFRYLNAFIGNWKTTGNVEARPGTAAKTILGTDTYEWMAGESLILHKVDVVIGDEQKESIEIIGFDPATNTFPMYSFDKAAKPTKMYADFKNDLITFYSDSLRFTGRFSEDQNTISGTWEQFEKGEWISFMEIKLSKY